LRYFAASLLKVRSLFFILSLFIWNRPPAIVKGAIELYTQRFIVLNRVELKGGNKIDCK